MNCSDNTMDATDPNEYTASSFELTWIRMELKVSNGGLFCSSNSAGGDVEIVSGLKLQGFSDG